jgi:hypothetical protein
MAREPPSLSPTRTRTERAQLLPRHSGRGRARNGRALGEPAAFHMPPEMGPGLPCWCGNRQPPAGDGQRSGHLPTLLCRRRRSTSCAPPAVPSWPRRPDHRQAVWLGGLLPMGGDAQRNRAWPSVEGAVAHPPGPMTGHGAAYRLPHDRRNSLRGGRHARLSQPQYHGAPPAGTAPVEPPLAGRQGGARRASSSRGRCHARPRRAMASPTRRRATWRCWTSRRYGLHHGALHTGAGEPKGRGAPSSPSRRRVSRRPCTGWGRPRRGPSARRAGSASV